MQLMHFVEDLGVQVIGGCCGTTPAHIQALAELAEDLKAAERPSRHSAMERTQLSYEPAAASIYGATTYHQDNSFLIIGERLNASGSKKVRELLNAEDWDGLVAVARGQVKENAHILDVNVDYVGRDGERDMHELVSRVVTNINLSDMETCYKVFRRELIQSISIEEDRFGFEPEITAKVAAANWRIFEVGISYNGRTYADGKKIGWRDGVRAFYCIVRYSPLGERWLRK